MLMNDNERENEEQCLDFYTQAKDAFNNNTTFSREIFQNVAYLWQQQKEYSN